MSDPSSLVRTTGHDDATLLPQNDEGSSVVHVPSDDAASSIHAQQKQEQSHDNLAAVVPQEDFDMLLEEFQSFKEMSARLESQLHEQLEERDREVRSLTRQLNSAFQQRDEYRERSNGRTCAEDELRTQLDEQAAEVSRLREAKRKLEDDIERIESAQRMDTFQTARLQDERDGALDRAILAEARADEIQETCHQLRKELANLRREVEVLSEEKTKLEAAAAVASQTIVDTAASEELAVLKQRISRLASKCLTVEGRVSGGATMKVATVQAAAASAAVAAYAAAEEW